VVAQALRDAEALIAEAVELEHERIALAAVDAGVLDEDSIRYAARSRAMV